MSNALKKYTDNIDWTIVVSTLTATALAGVAVYGMRKAGLGKVATVVTSAK